MLRRTWNEGRTLRPYGTVALGLAAAALVASSAKAEKVTLTGHFPAKYPEASQLRKLAISSFGGNVGVSLTSAIQAELSMGEAGSAPWFTIVAGAAGSRSPRRAGLEGTLSGSAQGDVTDSQFQRRSFECIQWSGKKCVTYATMTCTTRVVTLNVNAQIMRASDRRVVYSTNKPLRQEMSWCGGDAPPGAADVSLSQLAQTAARDIKRDISPYAENYTLKIKESTDGMTKPVKDRFKRAVKLSVKDLQGSCRAWSELQAEAPNSASLLHDLGVCAEARSDFAAAADLYQRSQALVPDGSKETAEATNRIRLLIAWREQVQRQQSGRQQTEAAVSRAEADAARAARREAAAATQREQAARTAARNRAAAQAAAANAARQSRRQQVAAKYGATAADAIIAGRVQKGMTAAQVQAAIGGPTRRERLGPGEEQWYYPGRRVIFVGGRVSYVSN